MGFNLFGFNWPLERLLYDVENYFVAVRRSVCSFDFSIEMVTRSDTVLSTGEKFLWEFIILLVLYSTGYCFLRRYSENNRPALKYM